MHNAHFPFTTQMKNYFYKKITKSIFHTLRYCINDVTTNLLDQFIDAIIEQHSIKIIGHKYNSYHPILVPKPIIFIILTP